MLAIASIAPRRWGAGREQGAPTKQISRSGAQPWQTGAQTLVVAAGCGGVQRTGGTVEIVRPRDIVRFAPGEKHWDGASATTAMSHFAIRERDGESAVAWLGPATHAEYRAPAG